MTIRAYAALSKGGKLEPFEYDPGQLAGDDVEIDVEWCGLCHSDLSMLENDWGITAYPFVPGHEVVGRIGAVGPNVTHLSVGQRVGLGWNSRSCLHCEQCLSGNQVRCPSNVGTIVHRHGGFAEKVRCQSVWAVPLPEGVDPSTAGPLFCGGITVFNPLIINRISPTARVAVVGIGGLGHMAIAFARAWGCEVTAFSTSPDKEAEARQLGAHHFLATRDPQALASVAGRFDMILVTINVDLDWDAYVTALAPGGRLHLVGAAPSITATIAPLIFGEKSIGASPTGSPVPVAKMLEMAGRHGVQPIVERFAMSDINAAFDRLRSGKARYRIVLENDFR
ncbi:MAG TPA: NAD(P)-dependent alcohol dehydrogenase [Pirellulaceae bacterium]|jgi:uncharacterized zinc-type alcohol dehydrogenase-like protein|nr:NAD(P)-dependent alcohol dehydrogenase [Pirellulaceae bacterium]